MKNGRTHYYVYLVNFRFGAVQFLQESPQNKFKINQLPFAGAGDLFDLPRMIIIPYDRPLLVRL